ncbi:molybdopterin-dependent oxidoreductase, partial [Paraburkholderia sp. RL18-103-BIB-C]|uniref:molybdopterin-dependent oxidoreductase n=1 Tax=Paraburkholderia sp. RL18-103-BIB-C TaxID=3031637 RepID=UPI0038BBE3F8
MGERRRLILRGIAAGGLAATFTSWSRATWAEGHITLPFKGGERDLTNAFPQKGEMILLRTRPPLLETPFPVFDHGVFTPNDQFYVRWHLANIPTQIDGAAFRLNVHGAVKRELSLSLTELLTKFPRVELAAVNQCSGNSRGFFAPPVAGGQWANGAMGNALWTGVRLRDILDRAGVKAGSAAVRLHGLDTGVIPATPVFMKSLHVDHARDGEVLVAYAMNGQPLPMVNGFPTRLIVPGWYSTYWVKMLSDIEVLAQPDDNFWMVKAYLVPDTPHASMKPGQTGVPMVPISRMVPRSFITNLSDDQHVPAERPLTVRGIAFGGDAGVRDVRVSADGGSTWSPARLGHDHGKYSFRQWEIRLTPKRGPTVLQVKASNASGIVQPAMANWN